MNVGFLSKQWLPVSPCKSQSVPVEFSSSTDSLVSNYCHIYPGQCLLDSPNLISHTGNCVIWHEVGDTSLEFDHCLYKPATLRLLFTSFSQLGVKPW